MKSLHVGILVLAGVLGLLAGSAIGSGGDPSRAEPRKAAPLRQTVTSGASHRGETVDPSTGYGLAAPGGDEVGRLSIELLDASSAEIARLWASYETRDDRREEVIELVFLSWTRLDPRGALAAVADTGLEPVVWRAWACHDPVAALDAALEEGAERHVAFGIGEFRPQWLRENWNEFSESLRQQAVAGLSKWRETEDPLATVEFLIAAGQPVGGGQLAALAREDPWAAVDWFERAGVQVDRGSLFRTLAESHPEVLGELAGRTPPGELRREMEARLFDVLLEEDPEAALRETEQTEAPAILARQQAAIAGRLLDDDPERALRLAETLLREHPSMLNRGLMTSTDNTQGWSRAHIPEVEELFDRLMTENPARMMEAAPIEDWRGGFHTALQNLAGRWARTDADALGEWIENTPDMERRNQAVNMLVEHLHWRVEDPEASVEWMLAYPDAFIQEHIKAAVYEKWAKLRPDDARSFMEQPDAPPKARTYIGRVLSQQR